MNIILSEIVLPRTHFNNPKYKLISCDVVSGSIYAIDVNISNQVSNLKFLTIDEFDKLIENLKLKFSDNDIVLLIVVTEMNDKYKELKLSFELDFSKDFSTICDFYEFAKILSKTVDVTIFGHTVVVTVGKKYCIKGSVYTAKEICDNPDTTLDIYFVDDNDIDAPIGILTFHNPHTIKEDFFEIL